METPRQMELDLLALSEQYTWASGDDQARADIQERYRALHARWMAAKGGTAPPQPEFEETLF